MSQLTEFKRELNALLEKHEASISFSVSDCSDTYGLSGERLTVGFLKPLKEGNRFRGMTQEYTLTRGWSMSKGDVK